MNKTINEKEIIEGKIFFKRKLIEITEKEIKELSTKLLAWKINDAIDNSYVIEIQKEVQS
jgi:hypothetical protein